LGSLGGARCHAFLSVCPEFDLGLVDYFFA
jgi:hypothetical protein